MARPDEADSPPRPGTASEPRDILIVGAGLAGISTAAALAGRGLRITLIDFRDSHPPDFRAEKIGEKQVVYFDKFGLGHGARRQLDSFDGVWVHRFGRIVEKGHGREYSSPYGDLVNALRGDLPAEIEQVTGRVTEVRTSAERQVVDLSDGRSFSGRLLVVATGLGDAIRNKLGIERIVTSPSHSVVAGFDLTNSPSDFPFSSLVWISERPADRMAYLTLFPMGDRMRANLFLYRAPNDPWCMRFRREPDAALRDLLPQLASEFGPIGVQGTVQLRPTDIATVRHHRRDGMVLIGDAFFTTCPVTGTGIDKALNDVDRLQQLVPGWLATPGMAADKICQFYDDPVKQQVDADSLSLALRERAVRVDTTVSGRMLRLRRNVLRRGAYRVRSVLESLSHPQPANH